MSETQVQPTQSPQSEGGENLNKESDSYKGQLGGARPGAGRPKGSVSKKTVEKREAERLFKERILRSIQSLLTAQMNLAKGASYLIRIDKIRGEKGKVTETKHRIVTDPDEIIRVLDEADGNGVVDEHYYYLTTKAPDFRAIESLIDRVFDKPAQKNKHEFDDGVIPTIVGMRIINESVRPPQPGSGAVPGSGLAPARLPDQKP